MPTSRELVANRPLTGSEWSKIILSDVADLLAGNGMLTDFAAYGRCSHEVRVTLHLDNPAFADPTETLRSKPRSDNEVAARPELAAIEDSPPLKDPGPDAYVSSVERHRDIPSPNLARIEHGLPVQVLTTDCNGHTVEKAVVYPEQVAAGEGPPPVDTDLTRMAKEEFARKPR
jgi:hypothetical protein